MHHCERLVAVLTGIWPLWEANLTAELYSSLSNRRGILSFFLGLLSCTADTVNSQALQCGEHWTQLNQEHIHVCEEQAVRYTHLRRGYCTP